jgi:internalin A
MRTWFGTAALLIVLLSFGSVFGVRLWNEHVREMREESVRRIFIAEGKVKRDRGQPDQPVVAIDFTYSLKVTRAILDDVASLPTVRELNLSMNRLADDDLKHLENMTGLEVLWLPAGVTDAGLDHLRRLKRLHTLSLGPAITDTGIARLSRFPKLRQLFIGTTSVTDAGLEHLKALPNLEFVYLNGSRVSETGIRALQKARPTLNVY